MKTTTTEDSLKTGEQELETVLDCEESTSAEDATRRLRTTSLARVDSDIVQMAPPKTMQKTTRKAQ